MFKQLPLFQATDQVFVLVADANPGTPGNSLAAVDKVVGGIVGAAPQEATAQAATSALGADGAPVLSTARYRYFRWLPTLT